MGIGSKVKEFFASFDLFAQNVSFRYKDEPDFQTATGGFVSITMIIAFIAIFTGTAIATFQRKNITFSRTDFQETTPSFFSTSADSDFMFAVGIEGFDMNQGNRYFDMKMQSKISSVEGKVNTQIAMQPCQLQQWGNINRQLGKTYDRLNLNEWLCPPEGLVLQLQGKPTSQVYSSYQFSVSKCNNSTIPSRPCFGDATVASYISANQTFQFNFYFVNKILNPDNHTFINFFLDDVNTFSFSTALGVHANIFINAYEIETDESITPLTEMSNAKGGLVTEKAQQFNYAVVHDTYMKMNVRKSSISIKIERSFRKADDTLSYVGGLFSAILSLLLIFGFYNQLAYQLEMAKVVLHDNENKSIDSDSFHIISYFGYLGFLLFTKICIQLPWPRMKHLHQTFAEIRKQMDIRLIMKKIQFSERVNKATIQQHKLMLLQLQEPMTFQESERQRQEYRIYKKIRMHLQDKGSFDGVGLGESAGDNSMHAMNKDKNVIQEINGEIFIGEINTVDRVDESDEERETRQTKELFRKLKDALRSLEEDLDGEAADAQIATNILVKIDEKIIKKFKHSQFYTTTHKKMTLDTRQLQFNEPNGSRSPDKEQDRRQNVNDDNSGQYGE